jgi:hypothetical protein
MRINYILSLSLSHYGKWFTRVYVAATAASPTERDLLSLISSVQGPKMLAALLDLSGLGS